MNQEQYKKYLNGLSVIGKEVSVLYVEDEESVRSANVRIFQKFFSSLTVAKDGQEGLELYKKGSFDLIITDINMPRMNGIEMTKHIKEDNSDQQVLVISAYNEVDKLMELIDISVDGFLLKPADEYQLAQTLYKAARVSHEHKLLAEYQAKLEESLIEISEQKVALEKSIKELRKTQNQAIVIEETYKQKIVLSDETLRLLSTQFAKISAQEFCDTMPTDPEDKHDRLEQCEDGMNTAIANLLSLKNSEAVIALQKIFQNYVDVLNTLAEFSNMGYALEHLIKILSNLDTAKQVDGLSDMLYGVVFSLRKWRESIFLEKSVKDIHYLDNSLINDCFTIETHILGTSISQENGIEFF